MSRKQFVKPRDGLIVRDPRTKQPLPADGKEVELNPYWRRRLLDGDIFEARRPMASAAASAIASAEQEA